MFLTIQTLFDDANIVSAIIRRVNQTRKDTIYWQQYLTFRRVTTRVFKDYIGSVTGVMAGSINSRFGEKPIRERRNIGSGYGEIAYLGDAYQMSIDRLSELQDLIDKFNAAKPADQKAAMEEIVNFLADDYRQITLAAHKRMDIIVGALLMLGEATVYNKDAAITSGQTNNKLLEITLPFNFIKPKSGDVVVDGKNMFISYLREKLHSLAPDYGVYAKMVMTRASFNKLILGSSEFGEQYKMILGSNEMKLSTWKIQCKLPPKTKRFCPLKTFNNAPLKSLDRWGYYYFSLFPSVCSHFTDTFSCQLNPVRRMYNTIHNGICYCRVSDCIIPIVRWQLRGDDDGLAPMSVLYYIEQDGSFLGIKVHKEEVIQYEQRAPFDSLV